MNLRLTIVSETYFPQINGVSRTLDKLVGHCLDQGDQVQLIVPHYDEPIGPSRPGEVRNELGGFCLPFYREIILPLVSPRNIRRRLQGFGSQLLHIATEGPLGWSALQAAANLGLPVISSYHTNFPQYLGQYRAGWMTPVAWKYLRWFHNSTLMTLCPTPSIRDMLEAKGFRNVDLWSRGVDSRLFHPRRRSPEFRRSLGFNDRDIVLVYLGRLAVEKNIDMLLDAWRQLPEKAPIRLLVIGDGPQRERLERMAGDRAVFAGYRKGEDLANMLAVGDLLVFPSLTDTFGNVMLEAMACGLPVLGFDVSGPKDVLTDGRTGILVRKITAQALTRAIDELAKNPEFLGEMGHQARVFAENQNWSHIMEQIREHYLSFALCRTRCRERSAHADRHFA
ncbi:MAG: glycosyltransferase family 1 protein [Syntrophotaleaceae bacterium]